MKDVRFKDLKVVPIEFTVALRFVKAHHRHNPDEVGWKFGIGCRVEDRLCGVAMVGRPKARHLNDGNTLEITRVCTDGTPNAASFLLGRARSLAHGMGYGRVVTYTRMDERGTTPIAAGFVQDHTTQAQSWNRPGRERKVGDVVEKQRWVSQQTALSDHLVDFHFEQVLTFAQRRKELDSAYEQLEREEDMFWRPEDAPVMRYQLGLEVSEASEPHRCGQECNSSNCRVEAQAEFMESGYSEDQADRWTSAH